MGLFGFCPVLGLLVVLVFTLVLVCNLIALEGNLSSVVYIVAASTLGGGVAACIASSIVTVATVHVDVLVSVKTFFQLLSSVVVAESLEGISVSSCSIEAFYHQLQLLPLRMHTKPGILNISKVSLELRSQTPPQQFSFWNI